MRRFFLLFTVVFLLPQTATANIDLGDCNPPAEARLKPGAGRLSPLRG
jgi:hypothetical protein